MENDPGVRELAELFHRDRLVTLRSLLHEPERSLLYRYAGKVALLKAIESGDSQVPDTPCSYGDPMMEGLLSKLLPTVEHVSGLSVFPTYSYFRVYKDGDVLARHTDRPSCEISLTVCLGYQGPSPWPIWLEGPRGVLSVSLEAGDGLLYRGIECPHWRSPFDGSYLAQVFLHYVDQRGPHSHWKFDKRPALSDARDLKRFFDRRARIV